MRYFAIILILLTSLSASAHELDRVFPSDIQIIEKDELTVVEYCPDNTCEVFTVVGPADAYDVQDFAYAYLLTASTYYYLESFQKDIRSESTAAVVKRHSAHCPEGSIADAARCIMARLGAKYVIRVEFVRFDEGERNVGHVQIY